MSIIVNTKNIKGESLKIVLIKQIKWPQTPLALPYGGMKLYLWWLCLRDHFNHLSVKYYRLITIGVSLCFVLFLWIEIIVENALY